MRLLKTGERAKLGMRSQQTRRCRSICTNFSGASKPSRMTQRDHPFTQSTTCGRRCDMSITFGDHLIDIGYHDITPEQEREIEAREECARRGLDPDDYGKAE